VFAPLKKSSRPDEISSGLNGRRGRSISIAMLLILVVLISAGSGVYAGASFFAQQGPGVTVTTTLFTTTTSWTTSTIWSTVTAVVQGILTTVEYTTSTSTVTVTGSTSTPTGKTVTARGNAQIDTAQSQFGGASGLFDGNGDYLSTPDSADWAFGSGDFTIDFWVRFSSLTNEQMFASQVVDGNNFWWVYKSSNADGNKLWMDFRIGSVTKGRYIMTNAWNCAINTWYHLAFVRYGAIGLIFIDGVSQTLTESTAFGTKDVGNVAALLEIGRYNLGAADYLYGWLDEFRVSKGVARWTSNFTPPTSPYARDASTVLLLHMDGADGSITFIDGY